MKIEDLDRRFWEWSEKDKGDPDLVLRLGFDSSTHSWLSLLSSKRVVILAEAGSGKSTEFKRQCQLALNKDEYAFFATVRETAKDGFKKALGLDQAAAFAEWLASTRPAWIFLDSVDEARIRDLLLEDALKDLAHSIAGCERRAHIFISGRHSDWEQRTDLEIVKRLLTVPPEPEKLKNPGPDEYLLATMRRDRPAEKPVLTDIPIVVVMLPLSESRILKFAQGQGIKDPDRFYEALTRRNLLSFARRPLDLEWLAMHWRTHGRFGTLAEMVELSIHERLKEKNTARGKLDPNTREEGLTALKRIGAALVLQRVDTIAIPDSAFDLSSNEQTLYLPDILVDWTQAELIHLFTKPIFDPAQAGHVRIHNDNQGVVRAFLTARWLRDLLGDNCPRKAVHELLFGETYSVKSVKPAMRETAAWMSIDDLHIAREVIQCDPLLLLEHGDPESLPDAIRGEALAAVLDVVREDDSPPAQIDQDALRRFSKQDIAPYVIAKWEEYKNHPAPRALLLEIIWLGELQACAAIATEACFAGYDDEYTQIFAARAVGVTGTAADRDRLARQLADQSTMLQDDVFWDGVRPLFPVHFTVADLNQILQNKRLRDSQSINSLRFEGHKLMSRLDTAADCAMLLTTQIAILVAEIQKCDGHPLLGAIEGSATKLLALTPGDEPPALCVQAYLLLVRVSRHTHNDHSDHNTLTVAFQSSPARRRAAFWASVDDPLSRSEYMDDPVESLFLLEHYGVRLGLGPGDLEWLLADSVARPAHLRLIADTCVSIWMRADRDNTILLMFQGEDGRHAGLIAFIDHALSPPASSEIHEDLHILREKNREQRKLEDSEFEKSWRGIAEELRAAPKLLRGGVPLSEKTVNHYVYNVWIIRHNHQSTHGRSPDGNFPALVQMLGQGVIDEFRAALKEQWRNWKPTLRAERPANLRSFQSPFEAIGILGISLEAETSPTWAANLSQADAETACTAGSNELSRFPPWFDQFCQQQPDVAKKILGQCISVEWQDGRPDGQSETLEKISSAGASTCTLVAPYVMDKLEGEPPALLHVLNPALRIVLRGLQNRPRLKDHLASGFSTATTNEFRSAYLGPLFAVDVALAAELLKQTLAKLDPVGQRALVEMLLPAVFGGESSAAALMDGEIPTETLEQLVHLAFQTIRVEDDKKYVRGVTYMHGTREDAEAARSVAYRKLVDRPGAATFAAIRRMEATPGFPILQRHLRARAYDRAAYDAQEAPWRPSDVRTFEKTHSTVPRTPQDLQRVAISRLDDIWHALHNDDFNQGVTVVGLPHEVEVQNWFRAELERRQGASYSLEREPRVHAEKMPDIRLQSRVTTAKMPMEIKVAESWDLRELEDALTLQLQGRYLRERNGRWGILLLVHQKPRKRGWRHLDGHYLNIKQTVEHLQAIADGIAQSGSDAAQMAVVLVDLSDISAKKATRTGTRRFKVAIVDKARKRAPAKRSKSKNIDGP